jgi:molybdenum cofactor cytidylyltransferase
MPSPKELARRGINSYSVAVTTLPVGAIILAAGASARMLRPKALLPWGGSTFVQEIANTFRQANLSPLIVVIRENDAGLEVGALVKELATVVINPAPDRGMLSSLQVGAQALLAQNISQALITPVDQPQLNLDLCQKLCEALAQKRWAVAAHGSQWGHPYACPELAELMALDSSQSAQQALQKKAPLLIQGGPQVLFNINTPQEYQVASLSYCAKAGERPTRTYGTAQTSTENQEQTDE